MARRARRSGINLIENERERHLTHFKRRLGLFKGASDLSTLTAAKVAIVVEAESGKKSAFGTPSADPIIDSFLSGNAPTDPYADEEEKDRITHLQDDLFRLEKEKVIEDKRERATKGSIKDIQENSRLGWLVCSNVEHLGADDLNELLQVLTRVQQHTDGHRLNPGNQHGIGVRGDLPLQLTSSSSHSQIRMSASRLPWAPLQSSSQLSQSSWSHSCLLEHQSHMIPSQQNEAHQHHYHFSQPPAPLPPHPSSQQIQFREELPPFPPSLEQPLPSPQQFELPFNPVAPPQNDAYTHNFNFNPMAPPDQNHAYAQNFSFSPVAHPQDHANFHNFASGQPSGSYLWSPVTPSNEPYFDASFHGLSVFLELSSDTGDQTASVHDMPGPSGMHQQADDDWVTMNLLGSPFRGESSGDGAGNYLGGMDSPDNR